MTLEPPERWEADKARFSAPLKQGESRVFSFKMRAPNLGVRFWFWRDEGLTVRWRLREREGAERLKVKIMHGYPNAYFRGWDLTKAKGALSQGKFVVLWLVGQSPREFRPVVEEFVKAGGGVVWMGEPFGGEFCPVELERRGDKATVFEPRRRKGERNRQARPQV